MVTGTSPELTTAPRGHRPHRRSTPPPCARRAPASNPLHQVNKRQKWWLPIIGPTASALAYLFARHAATGETCWPTDDLARMVGLAGNRSRLWLSLDRLHRFRVATFVSTDTLTIRLWLPALSDRQLAHLPAVDGGRLPAAPDAPA